MKENPTKKALSEALVTLCVTEPFDKISVSELTDFAKVRRQTFYYHYADKVALLKDVFYSDALHYLDHEITLDNWEEETYLMLKATYAKPEFYRQTLMAEQLTFLKLFTDLLEARFMDLFTLLDAEKLLLPEDKVFYAGFFAYGCSGVLQRWIKNGYVETPLAIAARLFQLAKDVEMFSSRLYHDEQLK